MGCEDDYVHESERMRSEGVAAVCFKFLSQNFSGPIKEEIT
jgi:hypothetical protein